MATHLKLTTKSRTKKYQIGVVDDLGNDPEFDTLPEATEAAWALHRIRKEATVAVWDDRFDIVLLLFGGGEYKPA